MDFARRQIERGGRQFRQQFLDAMIEQALGMVHGARALAQRLVMPPAAPREMRLDGQRYGLLRYRVML